MNNMNARDSAERFFSSVEVDAHKIGQSTEKTRSIIHQSSRLPGWLWSFLALTLGISTHGKSKFKPSVAAILHMFTIISGLFFGVSGLYFNVYDTLSTFTKTNVLVFLAKCVIGLYWILLGVYSHSLAARLFSNTRMVDCIRLHSKTFMKINMVFIIAFMGILITGINFYSDLYLIDTQHGQNQTVLQANCASIGVNILLCKMYFVSKVVYTCMSLCWNLMVAAICLSVCRTLTIGVRRFMRELSFDSQIYEEFQMLNTQSHGIGKSINDQKDLDESWMIWNDDIKTFEDGDEDLAVPSTREYLLKSIRSLRKCNPNCLLNGSVNASAMSYAFGVTSDELLEYTGTDCVRIDEVPSKDVVSGSYDPENSHTSEDPTNSETYPPYGSFTYSENQYTTTSTPRARFKEDKNRQGETLEESEQRDGGQNATAPIMTNEDLMFTYFKLSRRLSSMSRLLQRWMSSWISFVILWSTMLIIYWSNDTATLLGFLQFILPLGTLSLMTSAYAEVNFESNRILSSLLPTDKRMPVIFYMTNCPLQLKIFSFVMTYNVLVTAFAGVALTIASRIIIDQL